MTSIQKVATTAVMLLISVVPMTAQISLGWARCYNGPGNDWDTPLAIAVDESGNVYVTGASPGSGTDPDYATVKYSSTGAPLWVRRYSTTFFDLGWDVMLDDSANVYVTGGSVTLKYSTNGDSIWLVDNSAECLKILMDSVRDIYVAGVRFGDAVLRKIDASGNTIWDRTYNSPANNLDKFNHMVLDSEDNIIVTGQSWGIGTQWDYLTIKYSPNGDTLWVRRYNGPALPPAVPTDIAYAIAADDSGNVYITGRSDGVNDIPQSLTIKYSQTGASLWAHRYPTGGTIGYAGYDIVHDRGFIYVIARANGFDDTLLKYDLDGNLIWSRVYVSNHTFATNRPKLAVDTAGNIYHTSVNSVGRSDFIVLKYSPDGTRLWEFAYPDRGTNTGNNVYAIAVDEAGSVYLTGESSGWVCPGRSYDYLTLKLTQDPTSVEPNPEQSPTEVHLFQNYPNPFNASTRIEFDLPRTAHVQVRIFNILGQEVTSLVSEEISSGTHSLTWNADDAPSGMYICRLQTERQSKSIKLLLVK